MLHPTLEDRYFRRMAASLGDKARMLPWVLPGRVIDVGAGGGELTAALAQLPGVEAVALDLAAESLARLRADGRFRTLERVVGADLDPLDAEPASTIVFCSVLHEVHSYSPDRAAAVDRALAQAIATLAPGGRVVIRDGVMPDDPDAPARFRTSDDALVEEYLALSPHPELALGRDGAWWTGTRHAVSEAVFTVTWGRGSLAREALERYELETLDGYRARLEQHGFTVLHADVVTQPGYVEGLRSIAIESRGGSGWDAWFPPTNGLWVADAP